jgi:hypothetical protein
VNRQTWALDRGAMSDVLTRAMSGEGTTDGVSPFPVRAGEVRTVGLEVNGEAAPWDLLAKIAEQIHGYVGLTSDPTLAMLATENGGFFVDLLDSRFWLLHTTSSAGWSRSVLRSLIARNRDIDSCWLTLDRVEHLRKRGQERWFKADFRGSELLPPDGVKGRRLKVQLEGDDPLDLQALLREHYPSSTAVTSVALRLETPDVGHVDVAANYQGVFQSRGTSFDLHLGLAANTIQAYGASVRAAEEQLGIRWGEGDGDGSGLTMHGGVVEISFVRSITNMDHFLDGLFSCREPFRLWAVPRYVTPSLVEAEVVDLHVGRQFRMDIFTDGIRVYLPSDACGNTLFRLLANLQHRYDAAAWAPVLAA